MRTSVGPVLVILNLAIAVILVLVLLQTTAMRGDLDRARAEIVALEEQVATLERGVPLSELSMRLAELENNVRDWVVAFSPDSPSGDGGSTPAGGASASEVLDRLDEVLDRIDALDARVDEICQNVPVC